MLQWKAKSQERGEYKLDKSLGVAKQLKIGGFILKIGGDSAVFSSRFGWACHVSPSGQMIVAVEETPWGYCLEITRESRKMQDFTTKYDGIWNYPQCKDTRPGAGPYDLEVEMV